MQSYFFLKNETQYATRKLEEIRYNPGDRLVDVIPKSLCSDNLTLINHLHLFTLSELLTTIDKLGINGQTLIASEGMRSSLYDPAKLSMSHREEVSLLKCDFWIGLCEGQQFSPQGTIKQGEKLYVLQSTKDLAHADYEGTKIARMDFIIPVVNLSLEETDHSQRSFQIIIPEEAEAVYSQLPALEAMAPIDYTISELYEVSSDGTIERKEVSDEHLLSRKPQKKKTEALSNQENELSFFIKTPTGRTYVFSCDLEARFIDVIRNIFADFLGHKFVKNGKQIDLYDLPKTIRELGIQTDDIIHSIERVGYSKSLFSLLSSDKCGLRKLAFEAIYEFKVALRKDKKLSNLGHFKKGEQLSVVPAQA
ncbi:MAG: hypothetical protein K0S63_1139, partial [Gammaproteobacteria bacterium]|nr:hypothetical protein [Gammaproteobacteria bacterium]